jgi:hypothetical protein
VEANVRICEVLPLAWEGAVEDTPTELSLSCSNTDGTVFEKTPDSLEGTKW